MRRDLVSHRAGDERLGRVAGVNAPAEAGERGVGLGRQISIHRLVIG